MDASRDVFALHPGRSLGSLYLGASLHDILNRLKRTLRNPTSINPIFSSTDPLNSPVLVSLSGSGIRLRFDGPEQRLRLIEVLDFSRSSLTYNGHEIVRPQNEGQCQGPTYRSVSRLFGPTFPGEYLPPRTNAGVVRGTYICSYPGVAFAFPVDADAWSSSADVTALLMSSSVGAAQSMAIFEGRSWNEAREGLFASLRAKERPRTLSNVEGSDPPEEIGVVRIHGEGRIELTRASNNPLWITLSETTPQDLISELGPPDAIYYKNDRRLKIHKTRRRSSHARNQADADRSSSHTEDSDVDDDPGMSLNNKEVASAEQFFNYFRLGLDVLISHPSPPSIPSPTMPEAKSFSTMADQACSKNHQTATKVVIHGNVPGSWDFDRYHRCRWEIEHVLTAAETAPLTSEMQFHEISTRLKEVFSSTYLNNEDAQAQQRGMTLNRGWGASPDSSVELLGGWEEDLNEESYGDGKLGSKGIDSNPQLFGFPGLIFEVLKSGAISSLTVY